MKGIFSLLLIVGLVYGSQEDTINIKEEKVLLSDVKPSEAVAPVSGEDDDVELADATTYTSCAAALKANAGKTSVDVKLSIGKLVGDVTCKYVNGDVWRTFSHDVEGGKVVKGHKAMTFLPIHFTNTMLFLKAAVAKSTSCYQTFFINSKHVHPNYVYAQSVSGTKTYPSSKNCVGCEKFFAQTYKYLKGFAHINDKSLLPLTGLKCMDCDNKDEYLKVWFQKMACKE